MHGSQQLSASIHRVEETTMNMPMPSRFIPNANDCQMVSEGRADELSRSDKQRILFDIPESLRPFVFVLICVNVWPFSREIFIRDSGSHKVMICYSHWFFLENNCGNTKSQISLDCSRIFLFRSTHFTFTFMTCVWRLLQEKVSCCSTHFWMWHLYVVVRR